MNNYQKHIIITCFFQIFAVILFFLPFNTIASNKIVLNNENSSISILENITYFIDSSGTLNAFEVFQKLKIKNFNENKDYVILKENKTGNIWFSSTLVNNSAKKENYILHFPNLDTIQIFVFIKDSLQSKYITGSGFSVNQKEIKDSRNLMRLSIDSNNELILLINISGNHSIINSYNLQYDIHNESSFMSNDYFERYFQGIFLGVILIMILYNLFLFLSIRHKSYLFYVLMLLGSGLIWINNFHYQYDYFLTFISPNKIANLGLITSAFFGIFLILFTKSFLDTKNQFKYWNKYFNAVIFCILMVPIIPYISTNLLDIAFTVSFLSGILAFISILLISIYAVIKKYRPARYFFLANLFFSIGTILFILGNIGIIPSNYFIKHGMQFGNILEIALFSLALADRINILKKENEEKQSQIISQLQENEKLKDKVNLELEQKVNERTVEILQQKEEIETQRDEIESQRDLVILQKAHIEEINQEFTDSINYAKRIQETVLPINEISRSILGEHFILFYPKNIVSGDFYWIAEVKNKIIIVVADCTGHGVPGAFMSMLGISFLNEIVRKQEITQANQVLNQLRLEIINALQQSGEEGEQKDGMDLAFIAINKETNHCEFSGANNSLYIVKSLSSFKVESWENAQLDELKGDKMPIAIHLRMDEFTNHEFEINKGDSLYMFSDGYPDQFGGLKGKKFMSKNFKKILLENSQKPMSEQKEILESTMKNWIGDGEQIDDITVLGIRI